MKAPLAVRRLLAKSIQTGKSSITLNFVIMQPQPEKHKAAIDALEVKLKEYELYLEESMNNNEILARTKIILHEIKRISQKIIELKRQNEPD